MVQEECFKQGKKEVEKVLVNRVHVFLLASPYQEKKRKLKILKEEATLKLIPHKYKESQETTMNNFIPTNGTTQKNR